MAAQPYIQSAMSELQRAVTDLKQQAHEAQRKLDEGKGQMLRDIDQLERQHKADELLLGEAQLGGGNMSAGALATRLSKLSQDAQGKKAAISQLENDLRMLMSAKTALASQVEAVISQLNSLAALPEAR